MCIRDRGEGGHQGGFPGPGRTREAHPPGEAGSFQDGVEKLLESGTFVLHQGDGPGEAQLLPFLETAQEGQVLPVHIGSTGQ
jgi:hypothetical protein